MKRCTNCLTPAWCVGSLKCRRPPETEKPEARRSAAACCACGSAMHMAVTGGTFWKCGSRKTRKGHFRTELCRAREALKHVHMILEDQRDQNSDLELGSTAFKACLRWSSIYQHNAKGDSQSPGK